MKRIHLLVVFAAALTTSLVAPLALGDTFGTGVNVFDIAFVAIGNAGNAADTTGDPHPAGSVPYTFRMGKFEISEQMIDKADAIGGLGITKDTRGPDKPATTVGWNEAARFVNWLNTSSGAPPAYKFAVQPGNDGYNANDNIELWAPTDPGYDPSNLYRNSLARYFLPGVNEWYKAAFYDPTKGVYYDYPTGSDAPPTSVASGTAAGTAVFNVSDQIGPADVTQAGGLSPYGTMGQGGNVHEWEESGFGADAGHDSPSNSHWLRGGFWRQFSIVLSSSYQVIEVDERDIFGFRVGSAAVPEPSSSTIVVLGVVLGFSKRQQRQSRLS
jgi:Sulfatase-modifying factor enzyme 1